MERHALARAVGAGAVIGLAAVFLLQATVQAPPAVMIAPALAQRAQDALAGRHVRFRPAHEDVAPIRHAIVPTGRQTVSVPILMYHYIRQYDSPTDPVGNDLSVNPEDFRAQMAYLAANGYHPVGFNDLRGYLRGDQVLPSRPLILTFDDGYADFWTTAYPVLSQYGFKAVSYVVPGFFGRGGYMTASEVVELDHAGIEIASHTWSHQDLTTLGHEQLLAEVQTPKNYLEQLLGHAVVDFCYPAGKFNAEVVQAVGESGYATATTTQFGYQHSLGDALTWARVRVHGRESLETYAQMLGTEEPSVETWVDPYPAPSLPLLPEVFPIIYPGSVPGLERQRPTRH